MARVTKLTISDVAPLVGVTVATVRQHRHRGTMPEPDGYQWGHPWWKRRTIEKWLATRPAKGRPKS